MKLSINHSFEPLTKTELTKLTSVVKEVLAPEFKEDRHPVFSSADLWNIQRQRRGIRKR
ncbi:MAG TPA: hypothetical protein PLC48_09600 [Ferruginibacter sp.]|nr:hypothetical protein [Ferruginibacter sp.]